MFKTWRKSCSCQKPKAEELKVPESPAKEVDKPADLKPQEDSNNKKLYENFISPIS